MYNKHVLEWAFVPDGMKFPPGGPEIPRSWDMWGHSDLDLWPKSHQFMLESKRIFVKGSVEAISLLARLVLSLVGTFGFIVHGCEWVKFIVGVRMTTKLKRFYRNLSFQKQCCRITLNRCGVSRKLRCFQKTSTHNTIGKSPLTLCCHFKRNT